MSRHSLKSLAALAGLVLLAGLALMSWQTGRLEAASPDGGAPVMEVPPQLFWHRIDPPRSGPAQLVLWVSQARRSGASIQNVLAPLDPDPSKAVFTLLEDSMRLVFAEFECHLDGGSDKVMRCTIHPDNVPEPNGFIHGILQLTTAGGDVVEDRVRFFFEAP